MCYCIVLCCLDNRSLNSDNDFRCRLIGNSWILCIFPNGFGLTLIGENTGGSGPDQEAVFRRSKIRLPLLFLALQPECKWHQIALNPYHVLDILGETNSKSHGLIKILDWFLN